MADPLDDPRWRFQEGAEAPEAALASDALLDVEVLTPAGTVVVRKDVEPASVHWPSVRRWRVAGEEAQEEPETSGAALAVDAVAVPDEATEGDAAAAEEEIAGAEEPLVEDVTLPSEPLPETVPSGTVSEEEPSDEDPAAVP